MDDTTPKAIISDWTPPRIANDRWCSYHHQMDDCWVDIAEAGK